MIDNPNLGFLYHGFAYLSMFLLSWWAYKTKSLKFFSEKGWVWHKGILFSLMAWGISVWAIIPITLSGKTFSTLLFFGENRPENLKLVLVFVLVALALWVGKSQSSKLDFKFFETLSHPSYLTIFGYFLFRVLFLISYEIWFRGYFLEDLLLVTSIPVSIGTNILLYALIHIFASPKEAWSSLGFGLILCSLVIYTEAVWPAAAIHLGLSMGFEGGFIWRLSKNKKGKTDL